MKALNFLSPSPVLVEFGQSSLKVLDGGASLELALERDTSGRLTAPCKEKLVEELRRFLDSPSWLPPRRALCAIGARGVTLRRLALPLARADAIESVLALQIEKEFPLPPHELAWGYQPIHPDPDWTAAQSSQNGCQALVTALKRDTVEEYSDVLSRSGLAPVFTLGALARSAVRPPPATPFAILDIGRHHSELIAFEGGGPSAVRILPWGGENITRAIEEIMGVPRDVAEQYKLAAGPAARTSSEIERKVLCAVRAEIDSLVEAMRKNWSGGKLVVCGKTARLREFVPELERRLGIPCDSAEQPGDAAPSAAIAGLKAWSERNGGFAPLILQVRGAKERRAAASPAQKQWAALAMLLGAVLVAALYAEPIIRRAQLNKRLAEVKAFREQLPTLERELAFLQFLGSNQPPYLDAMLVLAKAAGPGIRINSLSMNRRGELSLRAAMTAPQATDFRTKLIDSGFFANVVLDELTPNPQDRQRVTVRISAVWKPAGARPAVSPGPAGPEPSGSKGKESAPPRPPAPSTGPAPLPNPAPSSPPPQPQRQVEPKLDPERAVPNVPRTAYAAIRIHSPAALTVERSD